MLRPGERDHATDQEQGADDNNQDLSETIEVDVLQRNGENEHVDKDDDAKQSEDSCNDTLSYVIRRTQDGRHSRAILSMMAAKTKTWSAFS